MFQEQQQSLIVSLTHMRIVTSTCVTHNYLAQGDSLCTSSDLSLATVKFVCISGTQPQTHRVSKKKEVACKCVEVGPIWLVFLLLLLTFQAAAFPPDSLLRVTFTFVPQLPWFLADDSCEKPFFLAAPTFFACTISSHRLAHKRLANSAETVFYTHIILLLLWNLNIGAHNVSSSFILLWNLANIQFIPPPNTVMKLGVCLMEALLIVVRGQNNKNVFLCASSVKRAEGSTQQWTRKHTRARKKTFKRGSCSWNHRHIVSHNRQQLAALFGNHFLLLPYHHAFTRARVTE